MLFSPANIYRYRALSPLQPRDRTLPTPREDHIDFEYPNTLSWLRRNTRVKSPLIHLAWYSVLSIAFWRWNLCLVP